MQNDRASVLLARITRGGGEPWTKTPRNEDSGDGPSGKDACNHVTNNMANVAAADSAFTCINITDISRQLCLVSLFRR